jgi:hypothetical protein
VEKGDRNKEVEKGDRNKEVEKGDRNRRQTENEKETKRWRRETETGDIQKMRKKQRGGEERNRQRLKSVYESETGKEKGRK